MDSDRRARNAERLLREDRKEAERCFFCDGPCHLDICKPYLNPATWNTTSLMPRWKAAPKPEHFEHCYIHEGELCSCGAAPPDPQAGRWKIAVVEHDWKWDERRGRWVSAAQRSTTPGLLALKIKNTLTDSSDEIREVSFSRGDDGIVSLTVTTDWGQQFWVRITELPGEEQY